MTTENFLRTRHSLVFNICYRAHHGWVWKNFQNGSSQMAEERLFAFGFTQNIQKVC